MKRYKIIIETSVWDKEEPSIETVKEILSDLCGQDIDNVLGIDAQYKIGEVLEED
jgi:hypothetical protein